MKTVIDGLSVNYIREGSGRPVLILPGWNTTIATYRTLVESISKYREVITLDMPGFGESSKLDNAWKLEDFVEFVKKFIKKMKLTDFDLIGHSNGGRTIIEMMSKDTDFKVGKIILIGSAGIMREKTSGQKAKLKVIKAAKKIMPKALVEKMKNHIGSDDYREAEPVMRDTLVNLVNGDSRDCLPSIKQPTLLIWGELDDQTPISDAEIMESLIPDVGLIRVPNCTHFVFIENAAYVNRIIENFLEGDN